MKRVNTWTNTRVTWMLVGYVGVGGGVECVWEWGWGAGWGRCPCTATPAPGTQRAGSAPFWGVLMGVVTLLSALKAAF